MIETLGAPPVASAPSLPGKPPVLVGEADNPIAVLVGAVGLFVALFLVGVIGPVLPTENPGARTVTCPTPKRPCTGGRSTSRSAVPPATQMIRPVVADVGLGRCP